MAFERDKPYNDLPSLPPSNIELETKPILKQAVSTSRALAELKGAGDLIPNQAVLLTTLGLQEAKFSSEIENVVTTNDQLYKAFADDGKFNDPATKEVLHYNDALWAGYREVKEGRPLSTGLFERTVGCIKSGSAGVRKLSGTKIVNGFGEIIYTPPEGEKLIRDKLENLERFLYGQPEIDPLVKMAVAHYQFEAIHPFADGNGRTGRILNILYLVETGLLDFPILYLSRYIIENKTAYYEGLRRITEERAWEDWILYMLRAVEKTAFTTRSKVASIRDLMDTVGEQIKAELPKIYRKELVELLFRQPYSKISFIVNEKISTRQTASNYLKQLEAIGILDGFKQGNELYYVNIPFYNLLIS